MNDQKKDQAIYLTHLDQCRPASALSPDPRPRTWRVAAYQTETLSGHLLMGGEETAAPEITLVLQQSGWHRIYLGLYPEGGTVAVQVRLTDDAASCMLNIYENRDYPDAQVHGHDLCEVEWKEADLSGQDLHLTQVCTQTGATDEPAATRCAKAKIAYIKLIPLSAGEVAELRQERSSMKIPASCPMTTSAGCATAA